MIAVGITFASLAVIASNDPWSIAIALALAITVCGLAVPWLGLNRPARKVLFIQVILPQLSKLGFGLRN